MRDECARYGCDHRVTEDGHEYCSPLCRAVDVEFWHLRRAWERDPHRIPALSDEWDALGRVAGALTEYRSLVESHRASR